MRHFHNLTEEYIINLKTCQGVSGESFHNFQMSFSTYKKKMNVLSLGAESVGRFAVFSAGQIFISENFGSLLDEHNFQKFQTAVLKQIKIKKPEIILTDLHPLYRSTVLGEELSRKFKIPHIKVQHHIAHIFSAVGDYITRIKNQESRIKNLNFVIPKKFYGIAMDGTGYGFDENIWGGEIFEISNDKFPMTNECQNSNSKTQIQKNNLHIKRIGSLEEQIMIGGDLAVKEPARMLIGILSKFLTKEKVYKNIKKYYTKNEFELLYSQLQQNFNCQKTTSTGRILDAVAVLLGFAKNQRDFKHQATKLLEENSTTPYTNYKLQITNYELRKVLDTTYLFEYLIKNIAKDKKRLAATAQLYLAEGLFKIIKNHNSYIFAAGGMANNKIISSYLENKGVYLSKKIPRGDEGIALGQIFYYLLN